MLSRLYLHIVWTTWRREPRITAPLADFLCRFIPAVSAQEGATVLQIGMVSTHLHLLVEIKATTSIPRLLQRLKGGSSVIAAREGVIATAALKWAKGYSVHSVGKRQIGPVREYIKEQAKKHPDEAIRGWSIPG